MHPAFMSGDLQRLTHLHITDCTCGKEHRITTDEIVLGAGVLKPRLIGLIEKHFPAGAACVLVADKNTYKVAGPAVEAILKAAKRTCVREILEPHGKGDLHADDAAVDALAGSLRKTQKANPVLGVLALGAGTINDIAKVASTAVGLRLITIPTAASMNGYTSAIGAILSDGVKTTQPCAPPMAILADVEVIGTAPHAMTAAGFADLLSKSASGADWMLGHILHGDYYCAGPARVVDQAIQNAIAKRKQIRAGDAVGIHALTEALLLSGISMALAGSSSPASGGEHLISHLWDMDAHWTGRTPALHGAQTGVTTLISLALYEKLWSLEASELIRLPLEPAFASPAAMKKGLTTRFKDLAEAVVPIALKKYQTVEDLVRRRKLIFDHWEEIRDEIKPITVASVVSRGWLVDAGAPVTVKALTVTPDELRFAYSNARWIRNRYTVLDLAADLGMLETWRDEVLELAKV